MIRTFRSSRLIALLHLHLGHVIRPSTAMVNQSERTLDIRRRNWHFISVDETHYRAKVINSMKVDKHLIGATFAFKAWGTKGEVKFLKKKDAKFIMEAFRN